MTQQQKMKSLFESRSNQWIPLYEIFILAKQYNARIKELRDSGMCIENKTRFIGDQKHSWFMFVPERSYSEVEGQLCF